MTFLPDNGHLALILDGTLGRTLGNRTAAGNGIPPARVGPKDNREETMRLLIDDAMVWNGTGAAPFPGKVLVDGERIAAVAPQSASVAADGAERIDAAGKFLMPGLVEGHAHLSFVD